MNVLFLLLIFAYPANVVRAVVGVDNIDLKSKGRQRRRKKD
jgi:hypothetical protein